MPQKRVTMRNLREILRLAWSCGQSRLSIAKSCGIGKTTVTDAIARATVAKLSWPLPPFDDEALERLLYPPVPHSSTRKLLLPNWNSLHDELASHKNLTLMLLWQEYKELEPDGYQYSYFSDLYRLWHKKLDISMRQEHRAGEKLFVDYCGQTLPIVNPATGEVRDAQVFVGVLGASNYTYAEATWSQGLADWTGSHVRAFSFMGGVSKAVVPDNLLSGVTKPCRYEPLINATYQKMAEHYGTAVVPARVRRPKDKPKAEVGVQIVQRFILAALRKRTFFTLAEANAAIRERLELLNNRPFRKLTGTRMSRFLELDKPALLPLPEFPYLYSQWKKVRLHIDYHFELDSHYYSAPHRLRGEQLEVCYTETTVECFYRNERVASHVKSLVKGKHTTIPEHMPKAHREYAEWSSERIISWAATIGEGAVQVVESILSRRAYPEHGFRSCMGIISLGKRYTKERLEAACQRALFIKGLSYKSIKSILDNDLDQKPLLLQKELPAVLHDNIRGTDYYNRQKEDVC
jgi:transposase